MAEQTTPPDGDVRMIETSGQPAPQPAEGRELTRRQVYALRGAWLGLVVIVSVGVGAVVGDVLWPAWGGWALVAQVAVSVALMVTACWLYEDVVARLRGHIERSAR